VQLELQAKPVLKDKRVLRESRAYLEAGPVFKEKQAFLEIQERRGPQVLREKREQKVLKVRQGHRELPD
jgi:hypothetical protein